MCDNMEKWDYGYEHQMAKSGMGFKLWLNSHDIQNIRIIVAFLPQVIIISVSTLLNSVDKPRKGNKMQVQKTNAMKI